MQDAVGQRIATSLHLYRLMSLSKHYLDQYVAVFPWSYNAQACGTRRTPHYATHHP
ncbi:hypothetical protein VT84_08910 [Gemmata sp. SH-PL17]|nr:hypothetical protein VT84_08910 [Gemmata sp. SH-PL17]